MQAIVFYKLNKHPSSHLNALPELPANVYSNTIVILVEHSAQISP